MEISEGSAARRSIIASVMGAFGRCGNVFTKSWIIVAPPSVGQVTEIKRIVYSSWLCRWLSTGNEAPRTHRDCSRSAPVTSIRSKGTFWPDVVKTILKEPTLFNIVREKRKEFGWL